MIKAGSLIKAAKLLALGLLIGLALIVGIVVWLVKSESGLRWAVQQVPDTLTISRISGDLTNFSFSNLTLTLEGIRVHIQSGELKWTPSDLSSKTLRIENTALSGVSVQIESSDTQETEPYSPWSGIDLPINIGVENFEISNIIVSDSNAELAQLNQLNAKLNIIDNLLDVKQFELSNDEINADIKGSIDLSANSDGVVDIIHVIRHKADQSTASSSGSINGSWKSLTLSQRTELTLNELSSKPFESSALIIIENILGNRFSWQGTLKTEENKALINDESNLDIGKGSVTFSGNFSPSIGLPSLVAQASGAITANNEQLTQWDITTDVELKNNALSIKRFELSNLAPNHLLESQSNIVADHGNSKLNNVKPRNIKPSDIKPSNLKITGSITDVTQFLNGENSSSAKLDLNGQWNNLGWPLTEVTKQISSSGNFIATGMPQDFSISADASGEAFQKNTLVNAQIRVVDRLTNIQTFKLASGASTVDISGNIGDELALAWVISSPDIADLLPSASGDFSSTGKLNGTFNAPRFSISAKSTAVDYSDIQIRDLNLIADGALVADSDAINLNASVKQINQGSRELVKDLSVLVKGNGQLHTISLISEHFGRSTVQLNGHGSIDNQGWNGRLLNLELADPEYEKWVLEKPVAIKVEETGLSSDETCLANQNQSICMHLTSNNSSLSASGVIKAFDLKNLNPLLSLYDTNLSGTLNGELSYQKNINDLSSRINAEFKAEDAIANVNTGNDEARSISIKSSDLSIVQEQGFAVTTSMTLDNNDQVSAELTVASVIESPNFSDAALKGFVSARLSELSNFQAVAAPLDALEGSLNTDIKLGGSVSDPIVSVQTSLSNGSANIPDLGLTLSQIELSAHSDDKQKITMNGHIHSGDGAIEINGDLDLANLKQPRATIFLQGANIELINTHEVHVDGNISAQINITDDLIELDGDIALVHADLDFQLPENAILASEDVVLIGEESKKESALHKIKLNVDLGDQTHIRAQGLDANLIGSLELRQEPGEVMRANGQIDVKNGRYSAYNQKLEIDKGQLIYNGGPIDDPSLELRAQKSVDSTTAGVSVSGSASSPALTLYSTPSLSDQDILSVLIFDKQLGDLGSQDGLTLLRIANSLRGNGNSKSKVDVLTQNIQESLGLSNLELQLNGNAPSISTGKQLSKKFYIGYGYSLLDAAQSLLLRYNINRSWSIQGDLGIDSGADLRYQIER